MKHPYIEYLNLGNCFTMTEQNLLEDEIWIASILLQIKFQFFIYAYFVRPSSLEQIFMDKVSQKKKKMEKIFFFFASTQNSGSNSKIISETFKVICISIPPKTE